MIQEVDKRALLEYLEAYLDELDEPPPEGEQAPDLFSLLAEVAGLKSEVKREARIFKSALEDFHSQYEAMAAGQTRFTEALEVFKQEREAGQEEALNRAVEATEEGLIREILELRDRMQAGVEQVGQYRPPAWPWQHSQSVSFIRAMGKGMEMNLHRLDQLLAKYGVETLAGEGELFDPRQMYAVDTAQRNDLEDGHVVEVLRPGYLRHGVLLRAAEVIVNKRGT